MAAPFGRTSLICLPYAGAGASIYGDWQELAGEALEVVALQPAGREERVGEAPFSTVQDCVGDLASVAACRLTPGQEVALFGHCLGAILAYELARRLLSAGMKVTWLFASGAPGPSCRYSDDTARLDDSGFLAWLRNSIGYWHPALDHPELRALILPVLRADVAMQESYVDTSTAPVDFPITAIRGVDDTFVTEEEAGSWRRATVSTYDIVRMPGGHMYLHDCKRDLIRLIEARVGVTLRRDHWHADSEQGDGVDRGPRP